MSLRVSFVVYLVVLHLLLGVVAWEAFSARPLFLGLVELAFLGSLWIGYRLIRTLSVPLELVRTGADLIEEGEFTSHFREVGQPELDHLLEVYNRMIDRLRDERLRVREQNEFLDRLVEASPGGVVVNDFDGRISTINPAAAQCLGLPPSELLGTRAVDWELLRPLHALAVGESKVLPLAGGRQLRGTRGEFRDRGFARDFFLLQELTEELRRSEKRAYGQLIRMISHEVNNSIAPVASLVDSIGAYGEALSGSDRERFEAGLDVASQRLEHLRSFVEGFANVVRLPPPSLRPCDVLAVLDDVLVLLEPLFSERQIRCVWEHRDRLGEIAVDKNQLEQVLVNVLKNAAESIGQEGRISLSSGREGNRRWLEIADTGAGLSEQVRASLFRPFYTTKESGRGLGLTLVSEILTQHGFAFSLENAPEGGAVFRVELSGGASSPRST